MILAGIEIEMCQGAVKAEVILLFSVSCRYRTLKALTELNNIGFDIKRAMELLQQAQSKGSSLLIKKKERKQFLKPSIKGYNKKWSPPKNQLRQLPSPSKRAMTKSTAPVATIIINDKGDDVEIEDDVGEGDSISSNIKFCTAQHLAGQNKQVQKDVKFDSFTFLMSYLLLLLFIFIGREPLIKLFNEQFSNKGPFLERIAKRL